jgi:transposase-like protein
MTTTYTTELAESFCAAIADGGSLRSVCKKKGMPSKATVFRWLREHTDFAKLYERATDDRADGQIEEIVEIADAVAVDKAAIQKAKLRIYARIEAAQKMKPRKYGRQLQLTGEGGGPVDHRVTTMTDEQLEAEIAKLAAEQSHDGDVAG